MGMSQSLIAQGGEFFAEHGENELNNLIFLCGGKRMRVDDQMSFGFAANAFSNDSVAAGHPVL